MGRKNQVSVTNQGQSFSFLRQCNNSLSLLIQFVHWMIYFIVILCSVVEANHIFSPIEVTFILLILIVFVSNYFPSTGHPLIFSPHLFLFATDLLSRILFLLWISGWHLTSSNYQQCELRFISPAMYVFPLPKALSSSNWWGKITVSSVPMLFPQTTPGIPRRKSNTFEINSKSNQKSYLWSSMNQSLPGFKKFII